MHKPVAFKVIWQKVNLRWNEVSIDDVFVTCGEIPLLSNRNGWPEGDGAEYMENSAFSNIHQANNAGLHECQNENICHKALSSVFLQGQ